MALPTEQVDSMIKQLHSFGEDGMAFDNWMRAVGNHVRAYSDVGAFKTQARALWLSHNKKGIESLLKEMFSGPNKEEREALAQGDMVKQIARDSYLQFLQWMGIRRGDTITLHASNGGIVTHTFDDEGLPNRSEEEMPKLADTPKRRKRTTKKKADAKQSLSDKES